MINLNLPEPESKCRKCVYCQRKDGSLKGRLVHWPSEDYPFPKVKFAGGMEVEPFSTWFYDCRYCRGVETKRKNKLANHGMQRNADKTGVR